MDSGTYVVGVFQGFGESAYKPLQVRTSPDYVTEISYARFDAATGEKIDRAGFDDEFVVGDLVCVKVGSKIAFVKASGKPFITFWGMGVQNLSREI